MSDLERLPTPALILDLDKLDANLERMQAKADRLGVALRPHLKTHKCIEIGNRQLALGARGATVSTLFEAKVFADHGFSDLTWAFPVIPSRVGEATQLASETTLRLVIDSPHTFDLLEKTGTPLHLWLKIDCGYHRAGIDPSSPLVVDLAHRIANSPQLQFDGLLTHSGQTYHPDSNSELQAIAEHERAVLVTLADELRRHGLEVPGVSVGSTPAMSVVTDLSGVTEMRPGNYALYDWDQVCLGSCGVEDCAATVLTSVVSSNVAGGSVVDAGALSLSKDLGPSTSAAPCYGRVFADYSHGELSPASLIELSQEHGVVDAEFATGERLRVLPNHSCLTVAQFDHFVVMRGEGIVDRWKIWRGRD